MWGGERAEGVWGGEQYITCTDILNFFSFRQIYISGCENYLLSLCPQSSGFSEVGQFCSN